MNSTKRKRPRSKEKNAQTKAEDEIAKLEEGLKEKSLKELIKDLELAKKGTHPILLLKNAEFDRKAKEAERKAELSYQITMQRIEDEYQAKKEEIRKKEERLMRELKEEMTKELDEQERRIETEFHSLEINKPIQSLPVETSKKTLRGKGGVLIEPPTYFNATPKTNVISVNTTAKFLLDEKDIAEDLAYIESTSSSEPKKTYKLHDVNMQKMKFTYDGKTYKQGEEVIVQNAEYGKMPAKIEYVLDSVVSFKASQSWDIRQIHASHSDLVEGRVKVMKKK